MKKVVLTFCFFILFTVLNNIFSNPIVTYFINEFMFDSSGWKLELHLSGTLEDSLLLDDWYLTSNTDTAYFKQGIYLTKYDYMVITEDSLLSQLNIDHQNDTLTLFYSLGFQADILFIGNPVLQAGQSTCLRIYQDGPWQNSYYYLDNSPTFGFENDTSNSKGYIDGFVKDTLDNPIEGVKVIYGYIDNSPNPSIPIYVETNSSGYFCLREFSISKRLEFQMDGYSAPDTVLQIWPDSTVTINIQMKVVVGITELPSESVTGFQLGQNYPNPFNNSTSFIYSLSEQGFVEINIYDEKGELIQKLFNGYQPKGEYKVNWNADNLASGIYFYELKTNSQKISKKCLLLK